MMATAPSSNGAAQASSSRPGLASSPSSSTGGGRVSRVMVSTNPRALLQAKQLRKLAEEDAVRLANRIEQLRKEEVKAAKKIHETRRRAEEIITLRERNERMRREKEKREVEKRNEVMMQAKVMRKLKKEHLEKKNRSQEILVKQKGEAVAQTKRTRAENERTKQEQKVADRKRALGTKAKDEDIRRLSACKSVRSMTRCLESHGDSLRKSARQSSSSMTLTLLRIAVDCKRQRTSENHTPQGESVHVSACRVYSPRR